MKAFTDEIKTFLSKRANLSRPEPLSFDEFFSRIPNTQLYRISPSPTPPSPPSAPAFEHPTSRTVRPTDQLVYPEHTFIHHQYHLQHALVYPEEQKPTNPGPSQLREQARRPPQGEMIRCYLDDCVLNRIQLRIQLLLSCTNNSKAIASVPVLQGSGPSPNRRLLHHLVCPTCPINPYLQRDRQAATTASTFPMPNSILISKPRTMEAMPG